MIMPKSYAARVANIQRMCFSKKWLEAPDEQGVFPTNADRQTAEDLYRVEHLPPPVYAAFILQALAASGHKVSTGRLQELASKVGKKEEKTGMAPILVCTGTADLTIEYKHSEEIVEGLGGEESGKVILKKFEGAGHVLSWECQKEYNQMLQEHFLAATERME